MRSQPNLRVLSEAGYREIGYVAPDTAIIEGRAQSFACHDRLAGEIQQDATRSE